MSGKVAKSQRKSKDTDVLAGLPRMSDEELAEFKASYDAQQLLHPGWDEKEKLLISQTNDQVSIQFANKVTDGRLATVVIERAARVVAQLASGTVRALTKKNRGLGMLMGLFLSKYIQKRDNAQYTHLTKMRMIDMYSQVYGVMPVLYDLSVTEKYLGPSSHMLPIRLWFPQPGKLSVDDSDYNHVESWVSASWLKAQKGVGSWNEKVLDYLIKTLEEDGGVSPAQSDRQQRSVVQRDREPNTEGGKGDAGQIRLITRYGQGNEGRWKTFFPDYNNVIGRDTKSKDGYIPVVLKHHIPLIDSIYGLGAFERGKTIQYAMDSLVAMYMAGVQMSIFPPRIVQKGQVVLNSLDYAPGATWIETVKDSIRNYQVSPDGLNSFQSTYGWLTGSLLNQNGATDTSQTVGSTADPTAGKTPEALKRQQQRESAADNWDRSMMEQFLETLYERQLNLAKLTPKPFTFHIFDAEIAQLKEAGMTDVMEIFDTEKEAKVTLDKGKFGDATFKFVIDAKSTIESDEEAEHTALTEIVKTLAENPQMQYYLHNEGKTLKLGLLFERWVQTGGLSYGDELIVDLPKPKPVELTPQQKAQIAKMPPDKQKQIMAQIQGQGQPQQQPGQMGAGMNPAMYPSKRMIESIDYADLPLWAQVQMLPMAGVQIPPAVQQQAQAQGQNPPAVVDPNAPKPVAPTAPDPSKDPNHQMLLQLIDKLDPASLRKVIQSVGLPANSMLPIEAEMINKLSQPSKTDEQPIAADIQTIEVDPSSPYGAAMDPHAHLQASQDPNVQAMYQALAAHPALQDGQQPQLAAPASPVPAGAPA